MADPAPQKAGWNRNLFLAVIGATLQGAVIGWSIGVMGNSEKAIKRWLCDSEGQKYGPEGDDVKPGCDRKLAYTAMVAAFCFGGLGGSFLINFLASRLGRRGTLLWSNGIVFIASLLMTGSRECGPTGGVWVMGFGRVFAGAHAGLVSGIQGMYVSEIAPTKQRGFAGSLFQFWLVVGILWAQIFGLLLGKDYYWFWLFLILTAPAAASMGLLFFCPESPKHSLVIRNQDQVAEKALRWLRRTPDVQRELDDIKAEREQDRQNPAVSWASLWTNIALFRPLFISVVLMMAQQLSGINAIMFYSTSIFTSAGLKQSAPVLTVGIGFVNLVMTIVSILIVDKPWAGRRKLLLGGLAGMAVVTMLMSVCLGLQHRVDALKYMSILWIYLFIALFAVGLGPIPWFIVSEMVVSSARGKVVTAANAVNWASNIVVTLCFPFLNDALGNATFLVFTILLIFFCGFVYKRVPETNRKEVAEVARIFEVRPATS